MIAARWAAFALAMSAMVAIWFLTVSVTTLVLAVIFALAFGLFVATFWGRAERAPAPPIPLPETEAEAAPRRARWAAVSPFFDQEASALGRLDKLDGVGSRRASTR